MRTAILILSLALTGCAGNPPRWLAAMYDGADACQFQNIQGATMNEKVANMPGYCGASNGRAVIYRTPYGQPVGAPAGYVKTR